jgi:hypothetical protein
MKSFWKAALAIGGTATVGGFILWSIYKQWLSLPIFPQLTQDQAFSLFRYLLIFTFLAFVILALVHMLRGRRHDPDSTHVFALHSSWNGVNEVDPENLVGPDITNGVRALAITTRSWEKKLVPKGVIIDSHFDDFEILYQALSGCQKVVPGFEKHGTKCADLITPGMNRAYSQMKTYKQKKDIK